MAAQNDDAGGALKSGAGGSFVCRQTSTRWTPTAEQIRILKDLYYNNGVRSPTAEQIQRISAKLRQYGKIEGKNVFYWFQNHKARERQKKRFTADHLHRPPPPPPPHLSDHLNNSVSSVYSKSVTPTSSGFLSPGHGCSFAMERKFREFSVTPSNHHQSFVAWDPFSATAAYQQNPTFLDEKRKLKLPMRMEDEDEAPAREIETLSLFPIHGEMAKFTSDGGEFSLLGSDGACLELTLNSSSYHHDNEPYFPSSP